MTHFKRPESVLVFIYTRDAQVLMLQRVTPSDFWQSVTGSLQQDELPQQAAARELAEETGLQVDQGQLIDTGITNRFAILPAWRARYAPEVKENLEHVFHFEMDTAVPIAINPTEHQGAIWCSPQKAFELASSETNQQTIAQVFPEIN